MESAYECTNLYELAEYLERQDELDGDYPIFGGHELKMHPFIFSWDTESVLVCDVNNGGDFEIIDRDELTEWLRKNNG